METKHTAPAYRPKVLVTVHGGVAEAFYDDKAVDVHLADYDNEPDQKLPKAFAKLLQEGYRERYRSVLESLPELLDAAQAVIDNWEKGDLAGSVTRLSGAVAKSRQAKESR